MFHIIISAFLTVMNKTIQDNNMHRSVITPKHLVLAHSIRESGIPECDNSGLFASISKNGYCFFFVNENVGLKYLDTFLLCLNQTLPCLVLSPR